MPSVSSLVYLPSGHILLTRGFRCLDRVRPAEPSWKVARDDRAARHLIPAGPGVARKPMAGVRTPLGSVRPGGPRALGTGE